MKCQSLFSGKKKKKKNFSKCRLLKFLPKVLSVKCTLMSEILYSLMAPFERQCQIYAPSEDSDEPVHLCSLIGIFTWCIFDSQGCKVSSCGQQRF